MCERNTHVIPQLANFLDLLKYMYNECHCLLLDTVCIINYCPCACQVMEVHLHALRETCTKGNMCHHGNEALQYHTFSMCCMWRNAKQGGGGGGRGMKEGGREG